MRPFRWGAESKMASALVLAGIIVGVASGLALL